MANPRPLTRAELAKFLPDQRAIRAFEQLFDLIPDDLLTLLAAIDEVGVDAVTAAAKAQSALDQLTRIADAVELLASEPREDKHTFLKGDYIDFPVAGAHIQRERRVQWNEDDGTMDVGLYGGSVLQVGQEIMYYAKNTSGVLIPNGTPVMFTGTVGASGKLTFGLAVADGSVSPSYMMGVATQDIANNDFGYVTDFGLVRGIDTSGTPYGETWNDGDLLYFDSATAGTWTNVAPSAPSLKKPVAVVINAASGGSGSIFVRMDINDGLDNLYDVELSSVVDKNILAYNAVNSRWENTANITSNLTNTSTNLLKSSVTLSDGSAGNTATLTNAPAAGNPTKWVAIDDNGTTRYIPAW